MRPTEEISLEDYRRLSHAQPRQRAKRARPDIPRAGDSERTGLFVLIRAGWSLESPDAVRYRLYRGDLDTGLCATEREACDRAKELSR